MASVKATETYTKGGCGAVKDLVDEGENRNVVVKRLGTNQDSFPTSELRRLPSWIHDFMWNATL